MHWPRIHQCGVLAINRALAAGSRDGGAVLQAERKWRMHRGVAQVDGANLTLEALLGGLQPAQRRDLCGE